ncbi:MAG: GNAT family N-acetyltransferase [Lachnospiraceae bacterium]|nr:GNAT family N-acetyltransferase [Lachnospiraceae bacterium]
MNTNIRRAADADIPALLRLLSQVLELHAQNRPDIFIPGTTKYTEPELQELLRDETRPIYVAADDDGAVLGYAFCQLRRPPFTTTMVPFTAFFIDDLCVDETVRGQHIGEALFSHVLSEAKRLGCRDVTLNVWSFNEGARAFYERMGMTPKETLMEIRVP